MKEEWLRRMLFLGIALAIFQQMVGINTIVYYTPTILQAAGFKPSQAILTAVGLQSLSVIMTVLLGRIVDHVGRKPLLIGGALVMAASMAALGIIFSFTCWPSAAARRSPSPASLSSRPPSPSPGDPSSGSSCPNSCR